MDIVYTLGDLVANLAQLGYDLLALAWRHIFIILWIVWWLCAVNWRRTWPALRQGAWAPLVLLVLATALVWSRIAPAPCDCLVLVTVPNFWWQLGYVAMLVAIAFFCGWLQGVLQWAPAEVNFDPPVHGHHDHGHDHGHSHGDHEHSHGDHGHSHGDHGHGHH